jgi:hypothetical protein
MVPTMSCSRGRGGTSRAWRSLRGKRRCSSRQRPPWTTRFTGSRTAAGAGGPSSRWATAWRIRRKTLPIRAKHAGPRGASGSTFRERQALRSPAGGKPWAGPQSGTGPRRRPPGPPSPVTASLVQQVGSLGPPGAQGQVWTAVGRGGGFSWELSLHALRRPAAQPRVGTKYPALQHLDAPFHRPERMVRRALNWRKKLGV